ncbi:hypothetical protein CEDIAZO_01617 [Celerinatantimonas diazotrophica]|nr:hypothetical protein CEDIAZO_01617 [Celerinatantimonas diazotrophica]
MMALTSTYLEVLFSIHNANQGNRMQNNYIKELAKKTFQEAPAIEYCPSRKRYLHLPSFLIGVISSVLLILLL